jgi:agmatinase
VLDPAERWRRFHGQDWKAPWAGLLTFAELPYTCRSVAARVRLVGADVVEVCPVQIGSLDRTALVAERIVREIMTGIALRKQGDAGS